MKGTVFALRRGSQRGGLEHDPEKWMPVFRKDRTPTDAEDEIAAMRRTAPAAVATHERKQRRSHMRRTLIIAVLILSSVSTAFAASHTNPNLQPGDTFIDPDTGMSCHNTGFASICQSPQGTVHYTNKHGLNCTRTGFASICTNF
jgi:hypothetical protein